MAKVFVHTQSGKGKSDWKNDSREFLRLPVVGEYFALSSTGEWFQVDLVVHCPFDGQYAAEVFGTQIDHLEVKKEAFR